MTNYKKNITDFLSSRIFLISSCLIIFALSIFLRSLIDIGSDTGVYINVGKRIAEGGRYYYDFFESNFPLSFYFYALEYQIAHLLHINHIIFSEITINFLAILSIFWSSKILKNSTIYENKAHYNLIIIGYFFGFFLRPHALQIGEFGTKSSLLLIMLFPYISYSLERKILLTTKDLIYRGCLMGLMPCIKPHYLILIIFTEFYRFLQKKSLRFFLELDKLMMLLIGVLYLFLMIKFTPEFFEFIIPIWSQVYSAYGDPQIFFENIWRHFAARINIFALIFLIFSRLKFSENDKILTVFFVAVSTLILLENIATSDQVAVFYAMTTVCFLKFLFDLFTSEIISFFDNKFIIITLIFLPLFDLEILPASIFGLSGFINVWWLIVLVYPLFYVKNLSKMWFFVGAVFYFLMLLSAVLTLKYLGRWQYIAVNLFFLFVTLFFFEKKIHSKISSKFSQFSVFVIIASTSCLLYSYVASIDNLIGRRNNYVSPNKLFDAVAYYSRIYAPQKTDGILVTSVWIAHQFPILNYLEKENYHKFPIAMIQARKEMAAHHSMFQTNVPEKIFALSYFFDDIKNQIKNPQVKLLFINNSPDIINKNDRCIIGALEYYFLDPEFKKIFLKNFRFENHLLISKKAKTLRKLKFIGSEANNPFDKIEPSKQKILYDFEIYVRI